MSEPEVCSICLSSCEKDDHTLECGHKFHTKCIINAFRYTGKCPLCRTNKRKVDDIFNCTESYDAVMDAASEVLSYRLSCLSNKCLKNILNEFGVRTAQRTNKEDLTSMVTEQLCYETDEE